MTILYATGFEHGSTLMFPAGYYTDIGDVQIAGTYKCHGNYGLRLFKDWFGGGTRVAGFPLPAAVSEIYYASYVKHESYGLADRIGVFRFMVSDGNYIQIKFNTNRYYAYVNTTLVATGALIVPNAWHSLQIHVKIDDGGAGIIQTKINGVPDISYSGDTKPGAGTTVIIFYWGLEQGNNYWDPKMWIDDVLIQDSGWPGDVRVDAALVPTADTATKDWVASSGVLDPLYPMIDEVPPSDADYVQADADDEAFLCEVSDWDGTDKTPLCVVQWLRAWKDTADSQQVKMTLQSGATLSEDTPRDLNLTALMFSRLLEQNPDGPAAWDDDAIDAILIGATEIIP